MNTRSQNSTATCLAPAQDLNLGETVGTSKTQVFVKRFDSITLEQWREMVTWCGENLYHGGYYEPMWHVVYPSFYFRDEREYTLFLLRWS
jgi:hypothetical protein